MTTELKPCPFCGKKQKPDIPGDGNVPYVNQSRMCDWCGCYVGSNWNNRPIEDMLTERLERAKKLLQDAINGTRTDWHDWLAEITEEFS